MENNYTHIKEKDAEIDIWTCNDCGAYAKEKEDIKHHDSCNSGESKKWENFYSKEN